MRTCHFAGASVCTLHGGSIVAGTSYARASRYITVYYCTSRSISPCKCYYRMAGRRFGCFRHLPDSMHCVREYDSLFTCIFPHYFLILYIPTTVLPAPRPKELHLTSSIGVQPYSPQTTSARGSHVRNYAWQIPLPFYHNDAVSILPSLDPRGRSNGGTGDA
jgi:hypothetical protein